MFRFTPYCSPHVRVWRWRWRCLASRRISRRGRASSGSASTIASIDVPEAAFMIQAALEADLSVHELFARVLAKPRWKSINMKQMYHWRVGRIRQIPRANLPPNSPCQWRMNMTSETSGFVTWLVSWQRDIADSISPCGISSKMVCMFVELCSDKACDSATLPSSTAKQ